MTFGYTRREKRVRDVRGCGQAGAHTRRAVGQTKTMGELRSKSNELGSEKAIIY